MILRAVIFSMCFLGWVGAACPPPLDPLPKLPLPLPQKPPVMTCPTPTPDKVVGYLPVTFVNNTGLDASEVFISVIVNSSKRYLSFSGSPHKTATIANFTPSTYLSSTTSPKYSYALSEFEMIATDTYTFYIPNTGRTGDPGSNPMTSSRILVSLKSPLAYFINNVGVLQVPSEFDPTNDTYYVLNDKIEFDIGSNDKNRLTLNLTWVDFFGLPILVQTNYQFLFGTDYTAACAMTGMPSSVSLNDVFTQYHTATLSLLSPFDGYWSGLFAKYTNPDGSPCSLRIYAPATAMQSTFTQSNPTPVTFPTDYFLREGYSNTGCTWFNAVWQGKTASGAQAFYQNLKPVPYLQVDATTKDGAATAVGYEGDDGAFHFKINGGPDNGRKVIFPTPQSSMAFFTGAVSDYKPAIISDASTDSQAQILKVFATSIISGFIPIDCKNPSAILINNSYVQNHPENYFENNAILTNALTTCPCENNIPWFDFYSRTLLTIGSPNLFYTSAYSDFLGTDGTIVAVNLSDHNDDATITVTLGDCKTGITFPDPYSDTTVYDVTVGLPANVVVKYGTSAAGPFNPITVNPFSAAGDKIFLEVTYTTGVYAGKTFVTQVAPAAKIFHPILPGQGQITTTGTKTQVNIGAGPS